MRATILLGLKNEGAFLIEWLAHHRACGFTDFLVYSNDCTDGTDLMLDRLQAMGQLTHIHNDGPHAEGPQW
jgi:Glycosyl transferase family 2